MHREAFQVTPFILNLARSLANANRNRGKANLSGKIENNSWNDFAHFAPVGKRRFNSSNQFSTTLICLGAACDYSAGLRIRNRWPSGDTS